MKILTEEHKKNISEGLREFWELNKNNKEFLERRSQKISQASKGSKKPWISKMFKGRIPPNKGIRNGQYLNCQYCGKHFYFFAYKGRRFCSRECYFNYLHGDGWRDLHPKSKWSNRTLVKQIGKCEICGFSDKRILMCHHKNGKDNKRENLIVLCANCHLLAHVNDFWFKSKWNYIWSLWVGRSKTRTK